MVERVRVYGQDTPAMRLIGKKYGEVDMAKNGGYGNQWGEWFSKGWFDDLEKLRSEHELDMEDADAYIGLMRHKPGEPFEYWIGMFFPPDTEAPDGYLSVDFAPARWGVAWLKGPESEIYSQEELALNGCAEAGYHSVPDENGACWFAERYACPRFTAPDDQGNVILDICLFSGKR